MNVYKAKRSYISSWHTFVWHALAQLTFEMFSRRPMCCLTDWSINKSFRHSLSVYSLHMIWPLISVVHLGYLVTRTRRLRWRLPDKEGGWEYSERALDFGQLILRLECWEQSSRRCLSAQKWHVLKCNKGTDITSTRHCPAGNTLLRCPSRHLKGGKVSYSFPWQSRGRIPVTQIALLFHFVKKCQK